MSLSRSIRWRKYNEYVKSCQIDHVVVGSGGIFLIKTKNWSGKTLRRAGFTPHHQIERAGYIFYIKIINLFRRRLSIQNIVVTLGRVPKNKHQYVQQLSIKELNSYILRKRKRLSLNEINQIENWLKYQL